MSNDIIDTTIAKLGTTPTYVGVDFRGVKNASFRDGGQVARIRIDQDGGVYASVGIDSGNPAEYVYVDSGFYKTAAGAAKFLKRHGFGGN